MPQGISAIRTNTFNMIQYGLCVSLVRPLPVIRNDKPVGFISNKLQELKSRFMMVKNNGILRAFYIDFFNSLSQSDNRCITAGTTDGRKGSMELPQSSIEDDEVRRRPIFSLP